MLTLKKCDRNDGKARFGGQFCDDEQVMGFILTERGVRFDPATFTKTILDGFIQADRVIGTIKTQTPEDADVEPSYTDLPTGESIKNTDGIKKWNLTWYKGARWQNELQKLNNSEAYSIIWVFKDDSILVQQLKDGMIKGFDVKLFTGIRKIKTAAEGGGSMLRCDLMPSAMAAWQGSSRVFTSDEIDFLEIQPIAEVDLAVPALVGGATTTAVKITQAGSTAPMLGLTTAANWKLVRNGVEEAITSLTAVAETYTFTHAALVTGDVVYFTTKVAGYPVYVLGQGYYIGKSTPKTVA